MSRQEEHRREIESSKGSLNELQLLASSLQGKLEDDEILHQATVRELEEKHKKLLKKSIEAFELKSK